MLKPQQGITFLDIFPVLRDPFAFETLITHFVHHITTQHAGARPDVIVGLDARGFLFGPIIAQRLGAAFVPVRKGGKLPGQVQVAKYEKEYGTDEFEMQAGAIQPGQKCIVVEYVSLSVPCLLRGLSSTRLYGGWGSAACWYMRQSQDGHYETS